MESVIMPKNEYLYLKRKAEIDEELLVKLIRGLEDIRNGKIKPWEVK